MLIPVLGGIHGCSSDDGGTGPTVDKSALELIQGISAYPAPPAEFDITAGDTGDTTISSNAGIEVCSVERFEMGRNPHDVIAFNPNAPALWPGAIVQGATLVDGILSPVSVARASCTVGVPRMGSGQVDTPNAFNVTTCIDDIVQDYLNTQGEVGTELAFTSTETYSFEQGMLNLGVSANWPGGDLRTQFAYGWSSQRHTLLLKFTQEYFTATAAPPTSPDSYFASSVTADDLQGFTADGNPLCYVSSVTYGRLGFLSMTSSESSEQMATALSLAMNNIAQGIEISEASWYGQLIANSEMKLLVIGGNSTDIVLSLANPVQDLVEWINAGTTLTNVAEAKPISYAVAHLKDNTPAYFQYTTTFSRRTCTWAEQPVRFSLYRLNCRGDEGGFTPALEGRWWATLTATLPDLPQPVIKQATMEYNDFDEGEHRDITNATWDIFMPLQAGAEFTFKLVIKEYDSSSGDDTLGDHSWTWTYPGYDQVPGDDTTDPPWSLYSSRFEDRGQIIDAYFKMTLEDI